MYKIKSKFTDIENPRHVYNVGDDFFSKNTGRVKGLLERGLIVEVRWNTQGHEVETATKKTIATKKTKSK